jgi:hypothetical protein
MSAAQLALLFASLQRFQIDTVRMYVYCAIIAYSYLWLSVFSTSTVSVWYAHLALLLSCSAHLLISLLIRTPGVCTIDVISVAPCLKDLTLTLDL